MENKYLTVKFDHDCLFWNPKHLICFPVVRACAKEITFPIAHMKTQEAFNEVLMLALSKGQSFGMALCYYVAWVKKRFVIWEEQ